MKTGGGQNHKISQPVTKYPKLLKNQARCSHNPTSLVIESNSFFLDILDNGAEAIRIDYICFIFWEANV